MARISGFWAGCVRFDQGGWWKTALSNAGGDPDAVTKDHLVSAEVPLDLAERWMKAEPFETRFPWVTGLEPNFPRLVMQAKLSSGPGVFFYEGALDALDARCVSVVGTRTCTGYGASVARRIGHGLAAGGVTVVSGLARGIDGHAHEGALAAGRTVAILAHGLAMTAPSQHHWLRRRILASGGAVLTTYPDWIKPLPFRFLNRNEWVARISTDTIVVEAPIRSGALHTARRARSWRREVHVVPGPVDAPASMGGLKLVGEGANLIDDLDALIARITGQPVDARVDWLRALFDGATLDEVARASDRTIVDLLAELGRLELEGRVVRLPGQRYAPAGRRA